MKTLPLLRRMMAYRPWLYSFDGILWMVVHGAFIIPGLLAKAFFDHLQAGSPATSGVLWLIIAFTAMRIAHILLSAWVDVLHRFTMSALLRFNAFAAILRLPGASPLSCSGTEALDYLKEDAGQIEDALSWSLDVLGSAVFTVVSLVLLMRIDMSVTLLAFVPLILVVALAQSAESKVSRYREASRTASERATGAMGEVFSSIQAVKVAGAELHALEYLAGLCEARRKAALRDGLFKQLLDSIYHNTVGIGTGIILFVVAGKVSASDFSLGDFSLFIFCLNFVSDYTCFWGSFLAHFQQTRVSFDRLKALVADPSGEVLVHHQKLPLTPMAIARAEALPSVGEPPAAGVPGGETEPFGRLEVRDLSCLHASGRGVSGISLSISKGELVVITGRIGSGKTTLLRAMQGLLPSTGTILWNGGVVERPGDFFMPPRSSYTPQAASLLSDTLAENLLLGLEADPGRLLEAIRQAVLEEDLEKLPEGVETRIGPRGLKLSGGQAQRTAAARMFLRKPDLYFIDDMSSALDSQTERLLWRRFAELDDRACIAVSHRRGTLELADRVVVLVDGMVEAQGKLAAVLEASPEMRKLWGA